MRKQDFLQILKRKVEEKYLTLKPSVDEYIIWGNDSWGSLSMLIDEFGEANKEFQNLYKEVINAKIVKEELLISISTLERIYKSTGQLDDTTKEYHVEEPLHPTKRYTLDLLSMFAGYESWEKFIYKTKLELESAKHDDRQMLMVITGVLLFHNINEDDKDAINLEIARLCCTVGSPAHISIVDKINSSLRRYVLVHLRIIAFKVISQSSFHANVKVAIKGKQIYNTENPNDHSNSSIIKFQIVECNLEFIRREIAGWGWSVTNYTILCDTLELTSDYDIFDEIDLESSMVFL